MTAAADYAALGEPHVDLDDLEGTIYDIAGLAVAGFVVRTKLASGAAVRLTLGDSEGVGGRVRSLPHETIFDASTPELLTFTHVGFDGAELTYDVHGLSRFEQVSVDVTVPRGSPAVGRLRARRAAASRLKVRGVAATEGIVLERVAARGIEIALEPRRSVVHLESVVIGRVDIATSSGDVGLTDVVLENVVIRVPRAGTSQTEIGEVRIAEVTGPLPSGSVGLRDLSLAEVSADGAGSLSVTTGLAQALTATWRRPSTLSAVSHRAKGDTTSPVDLGFLDGLDGFIHADVLTHVRIPLIPDWRAEHQIRLDVEDGAVEYERLEHGLSRLPDAVLDFELRDGALCLDKDIPLVPFDRRTLLSWPLEGDDQRLAAKGWIRLARLLEPTIEIQRRRKKKDEGGRFLEEVRIENIDVRVSLTAAPGLPLPGGGTLHLGGKPHPGAQGPPGTGATPPAEPPRTIDYGHIRGQMVMRPDDRNPVGSLTTDAVGVRAGLSDVMFGSRAVTLDRVTAQRVSAETKTRDFTFQRLHVSARQLKLDGLAVRRPRATP